MLWSKELVIDLIKMLKAVPAFWDIQKKEYRDRNLKFDETAEIVSHFKTNVAISTLNDFNYSKQLND